MQKIRKIFLRVAVVTVLLSFLFAGGAGAFSEIDLQKLKATGRCPGCNLENADLRAANLHGADLSAANLLDANLSFATWTDGSKCQVGSVGTCNH
ncbi:MAG: pentapeptide repeat-containing protein [Smithella sp.]